MLWFLLTAAHADPGVDGPRNPFEEPDESALYRLDEQLVTVASKYAQTVRKAPNIVSVITAEDIRDRGYRTLSDALRDLPGIYLWKSKEGRDLASFRGVISEDNNKILLLIDGMPWYDGVYTHTFVDDYLPIGHIQQIEVIKGPGSAIYGTNAFAGVINIVTMQSELGGGRVRLSVGGVGRAELTAVAGARTRVGALDAKVSTYARVFSQWGDGPDVVPRGRQDINGLDPKGAIALGSRVEIEGLKLQVDHVDYRHVFWVSEADDPYDLLAKNLGSFGLWYHNTMVAGSYELRVNRTKIRPGLWIHRYDNPGSYFFSTGLSTTLTQDGFETEQGFVTVETEKDTRRWGGAIDFETRMGIDHVLVGGVGMENVEVLELADYSYVNFSHDAVDPTFVAPRGSALRNLYGYAQHTWTALPELEMTAGARLDKRIPSNPGEDNNDAAFRYFVSPRVGFLVVPSEVVTAKILYGRAFRSPSVRELLVRATPDEEGNFEYASGNLDLVPEGIHTIETELNASVVEWLTLRGAGSYSIVEKEIDKVNPPNQYQNLPGTLNIIAAEAEVEARWRGLTGRLAYALNVGQYASGTANPYAGRQQYEFPTHMFKGRAAIRITDQLSGQLLGEVYGKRPRAAWSPTAGLSDGAPVGLLHLSARAARLGPNERIEVSTSLRNLFDTQWGTAIYREEADLGDPGAPKNPVEMEAEGRSVHVNLEVRL